MTYEEFKDQIKESIESRVDKSKRVEINPVLKNNGLVYDALIIIDPLKNISPSIYINHYYEKFKQDTKNFTSEEKIGEIVEEILQLYEENLPAEDFDVTSFTDFKKARKNIVMKLINTSNNEELLKDIPNVAFHDLSIVFSVVVSNFMNEYATILINNHHLSYWDVTVEELYEIAMKNTPKHLPYSFKDLQSVMKKLECDLNLKENLGMNINTPFPSGLSMYILTNKQNINGAAVLVYKGLLEKIANELNDSFFIIPSSINEVLIIPWTEIKGIYTFAELNEMIGQVNRLQLTRDEVLSNHAYFYNKNDRSIVY